MAEDSKGAAMLREEKDERTAEAVDAGASREETQVATKGVEASPAAETVQSDPAAKPMPTLRQVFALPEKETDPSDDHWKQFQAKVGEEIKGIKWISSMPDLAPKVCDLLDIKIPDVLIAAWKKVKDLQDVLERSKKTPDETIYLELAEHTINSEHKPSVDVKIKGATVKKIELVIQLGFNLKSFLLKIQNGAIREMQTGQCEAKGTIKYGGLTVAEKKLAPIKLPFSIPIPAELPGPVPETESEAAKAEELERIEL
jgi:hypothetical protein